MTRGLSLRKIIRFNASLYVVFFLFLLISSAVYLHGLRTESVHDQIARARDSVRTDLESSLRNVRHNLILFRDMQMLFDKGSKAEALELYLQLVTRAIADYPLQHNAYFALEKRLALERFGRNGFMVSIERGPGLEAGGEGGRDAAGGFQRRVFVDGDYQGDADDIWYHIAKRSDHEEITGVYFDSTYKQKWVVTFALGIYDRRGFAGMVGIDMLLSDLEGRLGANRLGKTGGVILVNSSTDDVLTRLPGAAGDFITVRDNYEHIPFDKERSQAWRDLLGSEGRLRSFRGDNDREYLVSAASVSDEIPWVVVAFQEKNEAYQALWLQVTAIAAVGLLCLAVLFYISNNFRRHVVPPLEQLILSLKDNIEAAKKNQFMNLDAGPRGYREIQEISTQVNQLVRAINDRLAQDLLKAEGDRAKAMHAARMASVGQMAGSVAHEINTPLASLSLQAEIVEEQLQAIQPVPLRETQTVRNMREVIDHIARTVNGLKALARDGDKDLPVVLSLQTLIHNVLLLGTERFIQAGIDLRVGDIPEVSLRCRNVEICQVMVNLLNNAYDAVRELPEKWVSLDFETTPGFLRILVTDSGEGIPAEVAAKIMMPFFTTKDVNKGTGLGLSISKQILADHDGDLFYDAGSAHTRFIIILPRL
ncbi:MAG: GHKL domain-containing protein [Bdellovibrionaceae bacterium]|nr:GHKL domain-containing protein [Pseudobdellovibrionaceae bacterium]